MFDDRRSKARRLRRIRVRRRIRGSATRPRLCVFRSEKHIYAQLISDDTGETLLASSTLVADLRSSVKKGTNVEAARALGELIGRRCLEKGITSAVFDRNGFLYHGRVRAVAEGARETGLKI